MNISIIDPSRAKTGAFVAALEMAECLGASHDVRLFTELSGLFRKSEKAVNYKTIYISMGQASSKPLLLIQFIFRSLLSSIYLRCCFAKHHCDLLILNDFYLMHGIFLRFFGFTGKIITWSRISPNRFGFLGKGLFLLNKLISSDMVFVSHHLAREVQIDGEVIYDTVQRRKFQYDVYKLPPQRIFVYPANYIRGKGQDVAIRAIALLPNSANNLTLRFHGGTLGLRKNELYKDELKNLARSLGVYTYVEFNDDYSDISSILEGAYAVLNFSDSESFSLTTLEASAYGLPIIATACGGPEEIMIAGKTGILIERNSPEKALSAILALSGDRELARDMGQAANKRFDNVFDRQHYCRNLNNLLAKKSERLG